MTIDQGVTLEQLFYSRLDVTDAMKSCISLDTVPVRWPYTVGPEREMFFFMRFRIAINKIVTQLSFLDVSDKG